MATPIRLSTSQLEAVSQIATPIPPDLRGAYLEALAGLLTPDSDGTVGDGALWKAAHQAQRQVLHPQAVEVADWPPAA
jgi:hypothetical protein